MLETSNRIDDGLDRLTKYSTITIWLRKLGKEGMGGAGDRVGNPTI